MAAAIGSQRHFQTNPNARLDLVFWVCGTMGSPTNRPMVFAPGFGFLDGKKVPIDKWKKNKRKKMVSKTSYDWLLCLG
jgi:hypothetical protein